MEGTYVCLWLIHIVVWQKATQHCKAIMHQLKIKKEIDMVKAQSPYDLRALPCLTRAQSQRRRIRTLLCFGV